MSTKLRAVQEKLRLRSLAFPGAAEDHPCGHFAIKVRKKAFIFLSGNEFFEGKLSMTVKLPTTGEMALSPTYVERAGYGFGKSGWVTVRLGAKNLVDLEMLKDWIRQSYRAIAPKTLVKELGAGV